MSLISKYRATEESIQEIQQRLKQLSADDSLKKELEFEDKLRKLMAEFNKSLRDVVVLLDPRTASAGREERPAHAVQAPSAAKRTRRVKQYRNPHSGEVIETKGGNHKTLKQWKAKWGSDKVESWATVLG